MKQKQLTISYHGKVIVDNEKVDYFICDNMADVLNIIEDIKEEYILGKIELHSVVNVMSGYDDTINFTSIYNNDILDIIEFDATKY